MRAAPLVLLALALSLGCAPKVQPLVLGFDYPPGPHTFELCAGVTCWMMTHTRVSETAIEVRATGAVARKIREIGSVTVRACLPDPGKAPLCGNFAEPIKVPKQ